MNIKSMAHQLDGEVSGGQVLAPGPGHSPGDRSMSVRVDPNAPEGFLAFSFAGDSWQACRDHVKARLGISAASPAPSHREPARPAGRSDVERTAGAMAIWNEARPLDGSPAMTFLFKRGIDLAALPPDLHRVLRWHPACPWEHGRHGCMVALFTDALTGEPKSIHRTAITPAGEKVDRMSLGPNAGCVIRLWPDEDVIDGLVIGEGIETTLAAATCIEHRGTLLQAAWATGFDGNMAGFPVLGGIEALTLLVDHDKSGAGQRAAAKCSDRWTGAGREVIRLIPRQVGSDFNNVVT